MEHRIHCRVCMAHCGAIVTTEADAVVKVAGDPDHVLSHGYLCPKGRMLGALHHHPQRLDRPMMRSSLDDELRPVSWDELLDDLAGKLQRVLAESGPDAVGDYRGTAHGMDGASRWIHGAIGAAFGPANRYSPMTIDCAAKNLVAELVGGSTWLVPVVDDEHVELLVFVGSNPVVSHGQFAQFPDPVNRLRALARRAEIWVIDPRRTETARLAHHHLAPRPGTDHAVLAHLVREILREGVDVDYVRDHARGVDDLRAAVEPYDEDRTADMTGIDGADLARLVRAIRHHRRVVVETGTGVTMAPTGNVTEWLRWALEVITGTPERPGRWYSRGWLVPPPDGPVPRADPDPWSAPASRPDLPARWGQYPCAAMGDEIEAGNLRALFVFAGSPVAAFPDSRRLVTALRKLEVLAVSDIVPTATTELATHVLPSVDQLERADLSNGGIWYPVIAAQYSPRVVAPVAERRPSWWVVAQLGRRLGLDALTAGLDPDTATDDDVLRLGMRGARVDFDVLRDTAGPVVISGPEYGWVTDHLLDGGRWDVAPQVLVEQLAATEHVRHDLVLQVGREPRVMNSFLHDTHVLGPQESVILVNTDDAAARGIVDGSAIRVRSANGSVEGTVRVTDAVRRGAVRVPHSCAAPDVARLTSARNDVDPLTGMAIFVGIPVEVEPVVGSARIATASVEAGHDLLDPGGDPLP